MLLAPQNLQATYDSGTKTIKVSWTVAPNSDTPTTVTVSLSNIQVGTSLQSVPPPAISYTFLSPVVSKYAGTTVTVTVAFAKDSQHTNAIKSVAVPGTPPPPSQAGPPTNLSVTYNPPAHSAQFQWQNHGLSAGNNYDKVRVQWGPQANYAYPEQPGTTTHVTLGPIYPNTGYVFQVQGGNYGGVTGDYYTSWAVLNSRSPDGTQPLIGWLRSWFQINPGAPLLESLPRVPLGSHKSVTALWGIGDRSNHLDLFLAGGIPTLGEVWTDSWQANTQWVPWSTVSDAVFALNVFVDVGAEVTAVWRPNDAHLDLFAIANDGTVWSTWWEPTPGWQKWFAIYPNIHMAPGASITAVWRPNATHLDLFVSGSSGALGLVWSTWWEPNHGWQPWFNVNDAVWALMISIKAGAKVTALWSNNNHLDLFATANDGSVWSTWWESSPGWQKWFAIDPQVKCAPGAPVSAIWSASGVLELFTTLADGTVVTNSWNSSGWKSWTSIQASTKLAPGAVVSVQQNVENQLELFGTDSNGTVWTSSRNGYATNSPWLAWWAIQPGPAIEPGATVAAVWRPGGGPKHLDLFARGKDGSVWSIWWEAGYWS